VRKERYDNETFEVALQWFGDSMPAQMGNYLFGKITKKEKGRVVI
jgi:hypothetical protein